MTEIFIVLATGIAAFLFVDPFFNGALVISTLAKTTVLITCVGSLSFHLLGRSVVEPQRLVPAFKDMVSDWWAALLLCAFIVVGSVYAIYADKIKESFLGMGLGLLFLPLVGLAVASSQQPLRMIKAFGVIHVLTALTMLGFLFSTDHLFHESIFVAVPIGAYFLCSNRLRAWQLLLGLALVAACAFSVKNTTFLMILSTLVLCLLVWMVRVGRRKQAFASVVLFYFGFLVLAAALAALLSTWLNYKSDLPSGNVEYRIEMYGIAWRRFLDSPVWGTLFTDSSVNYFTLYRVAQITQNLPTHSDILDILSHGGIVGILLWTLVVWRVFAIGWSAFQVLTKVAADQDVRAWRWLFVLFLVQVNAIITYAVNPPLINPVAGYWVWGGTGLMWALHRLLSQRVPVAGPAPALRMRRSAWA